MGALIFCVSILFFFLKLIVICRLRVIYVREDNDSHVYVRIEQVIWIALTSLSTVRKGLLN